MTPNLLTERDARFFFLRWRVRFFVLIGLALALGISGWIAVRQGYFVKRVELHLVTESGANLKSGLPVKFNGFSIGQTTKVTLQDNGLVAIAIKVEKKYLRWIRSDSTAYLSGFGPLGGVYVRIEGGTIIYPPLDTAAILYLNRDPGIEQLVQQAMAEVKPMVEDTRQLLASINDPKGNVQQMLGNFAQLSMELRQTNAQMQSLLISSKNIVSHELKTSLLDTSHTLQKTQQSLDAINKTLPGTLQKLDETVGGAQQAVNTVNKLLEQNAPVLSSSLQETERAMITVNDTIEGARRSWPLKQLQPEPAPPLIPVNSHE